VTALWKVWTANCAAHTSHSAYCYGCHPYSTTLLTLVLQKATPFSLTQRSKGQKWAFWALLITIGFVEILTFIASAPIGNARWQVNIILSALYVVGIGLSGYSLFKGDKK